MSMYGCESVSVTGCADAPRLRAVVSGETVSDSRGQVSVREHTAVNMTCDVDALPASTSPLRWYTNGSFQHRGRYLVLAAVERHAAGMYECRASNTMTPSHGPSQTGVGRAVIDLVVMCKSAHCIPLRLQ